MNRYFGSTPAVYAAICTQLDAAYGYPNYETRTLRTLPPDGELPRDAQGRVYLVVDERFCEFELPSQLLPELLATGAVEEVSEAAYLALLPVP